MSYNSPTKTRNLRRIPEDIRTLVMAVITEYRLQQVLRLYMKLSDDRKRRMLHLTRQILRHGSDLQSKT